MINDEWSQIAANGICHEAQMAGAGFQYAAAMMAAPSVLYRPALYPDGNMWCALLGDNLQEGVAGFGETPAKAMEAFDKAFATDRTPAAALASRVPKQGDV